MHPQIVLTFALASLVASASAAIALCSWIGSRTSLLEMDKVGVGMVKMEVEMDKMEVEMVMLTRIMLPMVQWVVMIMMMTSYISTRSTFTPHGSVASSRVDWERLEIA